MLFADQLIEIIKTISNLIVIIIVNIQTIKVNENFMQFIITYDFSLITKTRLELIVKSNVFKIVIKAEYF